MKDDRKTTFLFALFITFMLVVNIIGSKIITLFGVRVSVGILFMPVLFLITDIVGEVKGREEASLFVTNASIMLIITFIAIAICIAIKPHPSYTTNEEYRLIYGSSLRMTLASIISFTISQHLDVLIFDGIRKLTKEKHLWIRNNLSTITSNFVDTTLFMFIAFWRMNDHYTAGFVFSLILPYWIFKIVFALLDTPFCYLGVKWLKK